MSCGTPALSLGKHEMLFSTLSLPHGTLNMAHCTFDMPCGTLALSLGKHEMLFSTLSLPHGTLNMAHCKQQMPYMKRAIRLGRQHIPCRRLPALFFTSACLQIFQEERVQRLLFQSNIRRWDVKLGFKEQARPLPSYGCAVYKQSVLHRAIRFRVQQRIVNLLFKYNLLLFDFLIFFI